MQKKKSIFIIITTHCIEFKKWSKMVQKYTSPVRIYKYPFELVMKVSRNLLIFYLRNNWIFPTVKTLFQYKWHIHTHRDYGRREIWKINNVGTYFYECVEDFHFVMLLAKSMNEMQGEKVFVSKEKKLCGQVFKDGSYMIKKNHSNV